MKIYYEKDADRQILAKKTVAAAWASRNQASNRPVNTW